MLNAALRVKRVLLGLLCALMLFAQHVALSHAVWHAYQHRPAQDQNGFQSDRQDRPSAPKVSKLCALDAAFGQVLGCAPPTAHSFPAKSASAETPLHAFGGVAAVEFLAPLSRGPPSLL